MRQVLLVTFLFAACNDQGSNFWRTTPNFYPEANQNYDAGVKELKNGNWLTAKQFFQHVKSRFGFSKWAALSDLGVADSNLGMEKFQDAIDGYKQFMKEHPTHERVADGYAPFKIGEAYYKQIPSDWFLSPPSYEKDQGPVNDALRELTAFTDQYSESPYAAKGRQMMGDCIRRLADHELYVARFYLSNGKPYAAIGRLEGVVKDFPGAQREPETLLLLGQTYLKMEKPEQARAVFEKLAADHPEDYRATKAKLYIQFLDKQPKKYQ